MSNLEKKKTNDISIAINGEAFISRNKCAELLGLNQSTVLHWVSANAYLNSVNNNNQLNEDLFQNLVKTYRLEGNKNANALTDLFIELGVRAYLYSIAGIANAPDRTPIEKFDPDLAEDKIDFTITAEGEAFIGVKKVSELTGVSRGTLLGWIQRDAPTYITNENNQLDAKSLSKVVLRARDNNYPLSADLLDKILEAGATAFIYHTAQ